MAAGFGLTAFADAGITRTLCGIATSAYPSPTTNGLYCALYNTQFTNITKAGATEWAVASDGSYARQQMGTSGQGTGFGWTVAAYANSVGVVFTNFQQITFPGVTLNNQTLNSVGFVDVVTLGSGNIMIFSDLGTPTPVNIGIQVIFAGPSPGPNGISFTTF